MADVTNLAEHRGPFVSGPVVCLGCSYHWIAARPASTQVLECPECGALRAGSLEWLMSDAQRPTECCGQKDSAGICAAPACLFGDICKLLVVLRFAYGLEHGAPDHG